MTPKQRMMILLHFLGDSGDQAVIAENIGISKIEEAKVEWSNHLNFSTAFAVIDCTHIPIVRPAVFGGDYVNGKGFCNVNVQAAINAKEVFAISLVLSMTDFYETHQFMRK